MTSTSPSSADYALIQVDSPLVPPVTLTWQNLSVANGSHHIKHPDVDLKRPLLESVSGSAHPGELLAIAGPSNSGTSVLLECLARRRSPTTGELSFQPQLLSSPSLAGYVGKQSLVFGALTVYDHLMYQAELHLDSCATRDDRVNRVMDVAAQLGLTDDLDARIGVDGAANALPVDKRKLLAIAAELLALPSVLLVHEPTTGLDAFQAERVMWALQALAQRGHTVVVTLSLDAPSSLFGLIDKLLLLADGRVVYNGIATESLAFFEAHGVMPCPSLMNPFEFFNRQLTTIGVSQVDQIVAAWSARKLSELNELPLDNAMAVVTTHNTLTQGRPQYPPRWTQYSVLFRRNVRKLVRDTATVKARLGAMVVLMLLVGLVFIQLDLNQRDIQPFSSACFFIATTQFFYTVLPELLSTQKEVATALHEQRHGLYHALRWYIVKNVSELPLQVLYPLVFLVPTYFMVGFTVDLETFAKFYLFIVLLVSAATGVAYFFACLAPDTGRALKFSLVYLSPSLVFGGAFVTRKTTPVYFVWLQQLSPIKYCYHGLMRAFWKPVHSIYCPPNTACRATSGLAVLMINVVEPNKFLSDVVILLVINLTFRLLGGVALAWRARANRSL